MNPQNSRYYIYIRPLLKNRIVKSYGHFVFSLITITIFALFAIRPTLATIISLQKSINDQKQVLEQLNAKTKNLSLGKNNFDMIDPDLKARVFNLLPDSTSLPKLIDELNALAVRNDASISGLQFQPTDLLGSSKILSKNPKLTDIDFTLNIQGSYQQLANFLNSFISATRLVNVKTLNFSKVPESGLILSINASVYSVKN